LLLAALAGAALAGADDDPVTPEPPPAERTPSDLLQSRVTIYDDDERTATERLAAYEALLLHPSTDPPHPGFMSAGRRSSPRTSSFGSCSTRTTGSR
jgi:hypothetical protein